LNAASWERQVEDLKKAQQIEPGNYMTDYELAESFRLRAWQGDAGNEDLAREAIAWFGRGMALNRYDFRTRMGYGMCLDWLDRPKEATQYFVQGKALFPNGAEAQWKFAWHCSVLGNYSLAMLWLQRSMEVMPSPEAEGCLEMLKARMAEGVRASPAGR
jgi:tetratricopeptide (TPR) repeat protein